MRVFQCAVMGQGGVGKSAVTVRFINGSYLEWYDPTIEDSYRKQFIVDGSPGLLEILDTAGVEQFTTLNDIFIRDSEAFVLVFALNSRDSYDEIARIRETIHRVKGSPEEETIPIIIVGNKLDLVEERETEEHTARLAAKKWGCAYFETSARFDKNIIPVFESVVRQLRALDTRRRPERRVKTKKKRQGCVIL